MINPTSIYLPPSLVVPDDANERGTFDRRGKIRASIREERGRWHGKKIAARDKSYEAFVCDGGESEGDEQALS